MPHRYPLVKVKVKVKNKIKLRDKSKIDTFFLPSPRNRHKWKKPPEIASRLPPHSRHHQQSQILPEIATNEFYESKRPHRANNRPEIDTYHHILTTRGPLGVGTRLSHSVNLWRKYYHNMIEGLNVHECMQMELVAPCMVRISAAWGALAGLCARCL